MTKEEAKIVLEKWSKTLVKKWERTGLLDGLNSDIKNPNMAVLLESKPKQIFDDEMTPEERELNEAMRVFYGK
jgi:hypothetical protein